MPKGVKQLTFCKIVEVRSTTNLTGSEIYICTHECGKVERRMKRRANRRTCNKPPTRLMCDAKQKKREEETPD